MEKLPFWHAVCAAPCTFPAGLKNGASREVIKVNGRKNTGGECVSLPLPLITCCKVNVFQQPAALRAQHSPVCWLWQLPGNL